MNVQNFIFIYRVFLRKDYSPTADSKKKLEIIASGPHMVTNVYHITCVILLEINVIEIFNLDIVVPVLHRFTSYHL